MLHLEPYVDAAIASMRAGLPTALNAENAKHDDFAVPTPDDATGYFWGVETALGRYPAVEVGAPEATLDNFAIGQTYADSSVMIAIRGWLALDAAVNSRERLARAVYRNGRAILNVMIAPNSFGNNAVIERVRASYRINPATREADAVEGSTLLTFSLIDVESPG